MSLKLGNWAGAVVRSRWAGYAAALVAVALVTVLIGLVFERITIPNISMVYLIAVLAVAVAFGRGPAILASVAAFLTFNWFFVEPVHTFTVANPDEVVALVLFLLVAIVTGQLAARERQRAREAEQREREAVVLYNVVRSMSEPDLAEALGAVAERLRRELRLAAVTIEFADDGAGVPLRAVAGEAEALRLADAVESGPARDGEWPVPRRAGRTRQHCGHYVVPVRVPDREVGALTLVAPPGLSPSGAADERLLAAVATQLGLAVERARLRREATEAESLRRTDELKNALLNAVSHDLRTPLASIIASAGSLRQTDVEWSAEERREFAEAIEQEAQRLNRIVSNLLDLSRVEGGSLRPERGWYDLGALIDETRARLRPITARHHVAVDLQDDLPPVLLDYVQIDQVLSNLIENATKYAPPGTKIWLSARRGNGEVQIQVADRGPGVPPAALPHLFRPFYRVDGRGPRPQGTGLGLAVAKGLVEAHGGRIWARNRPDGGAYFAFTLPLDAAARAPAAAGERVL